MQDNQQGATAGASSARGNALMRFSVVCPVCSAESDQYQCNPRLFWAQDQDIDQQPRNFQRVRGLEGVHPPLYYMWHCPRCRFTAGHRHFSAPLKDVLIDPGVITRRLQEFARSDDRFRGIVDCLGADITPSNMDFTQAVKLHLLGLHFLLTIEGLVKQQFYNRGRYALRLAWLYRDLDAEPARRDAFREPVERALAALRPLWPEAPNTEERGLRMAIEYLMDTHDSQNWHASGADRAGLLELVARINIKLGELMRANEVLMVATRSATEAKATIDRRLRATGSSPDAIPFGERDEFVSQSRRLGTLLTDVQGLVETVRKDMQDKHLESAKAILAEAGQKPVDELRKILQAKGVSPRIVDQLVPEPRRKGLFGIRG